MKLDQVGQVGHGISTALFISMETFNSRLQNVAQTLLFLEGLILPRSAMEKCGSVQQKISCIFETAVIEEQSGKREHQPYRVFIIGMNFILLDINVLTLKNIYNIQPQSLGQIKRLSVFRVTGLKILGMVGTHIFFNYFFLEKI